MTRGLLAVAMSSFKIIISIMETRALKRRVCGCERRVDMRRAEVVCVADDPWMSLHEALDAMSIVWETRIRGVNRSSQYAGTNGLRPWYIRAPRYVRCSREMSA
jgi:hypothetical protein